MNFVLKWTCVAAAAVLLAGCITYPYDTAFSYCDTQAGQCYRACEADDGRGDYGRCHASCEARSEQCFAQAYSPYGSNYGYGYNSPWYGQWGSWYPGTGYAFSWSYFNRNYYGPAYGRYSAPRYGRDGRDSWKDDRYRDSRYRDNRYRDNPYGGAGSHPDARRLERNEADARRDYSDRPGRPGDQDRNYGGGRTPNAGGQGSQGGPGYAPAPQYSPPPQQSAPPPQYSPPSQQSAPPPAYNPPAGRGQSRSNASPQRAPRGGGGQEKSGIFQESEGIAN